MRGGQRLFLQCAKIKPLAFLSGVVSIGMWKSLVRSVLPVFQPNLLDLTLEHEDVKVCGGWRQDDGKDGVLRTKVCSAMWCAFCALHDATCIFCALHMLFC